MESNFELATLAGGCFWCTEAVFKRLDGVQKIVPGYTGGNIKNPAYREVCSGRTGHAEAVQITFNPDKISFQSLLSIFFATHDPTTLNRQGHDVGSQYRSAIFCHDEEQKSSAVSFIENCEKEKIFNSPIVTEVVDFKVFYQAESEHLDYFDNNSQQPYCQFVIQPKINKLNALFAEKLKS